MVFLVLFNKLKHLLLFFVNITKRALCCFRRRRRSSIDPIPLTHVISQEQDDWKWEENPGLSEPKTIQDHIDLYRMKKIEAKKSVEAANDLNLFEDMTPKITKQTKVFLNLNKNQVETSNNRLTLVESEPLVCDYIGLNVFG